MSIETHEQVTKSINVSASAAWACIAAVDGIENWSPVSLRCVKTGVRPGDKRIVTFEQGDLYEEVRKVDHENLIFSYAVLAQPLFPLHGEAVGKVTVKPLTETSCEITWRFNFSADEKDIPNIASAVKELYSANIQGIETYIKSL